MNSEVLIFGYYGAKSIERNINANQLGAYHVEAASRLCPDTFAQPGWAWEVKMEVFENAKTSEVPKIQKIPTWERCEVF